MNDLIYIANYCGWNYKVDKEKNTLSLSLYINKYNVYCTKHENDPRSWTMYEDGFLGEMVLWLKSNYYA
jgi:hypothetical protein